MALREPSSRRLPWLPLPPPSSTRRMPRRPAPASRPPRPPVGKLEKMLMLRSLMRLPWLLLRFLICGRRKFFPISVGARVPFRTNSIPRKRWRCVVLGCSVLCLLAENSFFEGVGGDSEGLRPPGAAVDLGPSGAGSFDASPLPANGGGRRPAALVFHLVACPSEKHFPSEFSPRFVKSDPLSTYVHPSLTYWLDFSVDKLTVSS